MDFRFHCGRRFRALAKAIVRPLKRQKAIEEAAQLLGLTCVDELTPELADLLDSFSIIGGAESLNHLMVGVVDDTSVIIGDYHYYKEGSGGSEGRRNGKTVRQTVLVFRSEELQAPDFNLQPENMLHHMMEGFLGKMTQTTSARILISPPPGLSDQYFRKGPTRQRFGHGFNRRSWRILRRIRD